MLKSIYPHDLQVKCKGKRTPALDAFEEPTLTYLYYSGIYLFPSLKANQGLDSSKTVDCIHSPYSLHTLKRTVSSEKRRYI